LWITDQHLCTHEFLRGLTEREASFIIQQPPTLGWEPLGALEPAGQSTNGLVME
jgi:hypothetical protein